MEAGSSLRADDSFVSASTAGTPVFQIITPARTTARGDLIAKRFDALKQLADGWCRGSGIAPDKDRLGTVAKILVEFFPERLCLPTITPTLDGNLLLEWGVLGRAGDTPCYAGGSWVNLNLGSMEAEFCVLDDDGHGHGERFDIGTDNGAKRFMDYLQDRVPQKTIGTPDDMSVLDAPSLYTVASERLADIEAGRSATHSIEDVMREFGLAH